MAELAARAASAAQAAASTAEIGKSSEFYGVTWFAPAKQWRAYVWRGGTTHHIAYCDIEADAARAVDQWLWENYREGPVNFDAEGNRVVRQSTNASIYKGVTPGTRKGSWKAQIYVSGRPEHLGTFDTQREAALARDERARQLGRGTNFRADGTSMSSGRRARC